MSKIAILTYSILAVAASLIQASLHGFWSMSASEYFTPGHALTIGFISTLITLISCFLLDRFLPNVGHGAYKIKLTEWARYSLFGFGGGIVLAYLGFAVLSPFRS